jgi:hypothetical protein
MKFLVACKAFFRHVFRDRTTTLEEFIVARNPQTTLQVEHLEREFYEKLRKQRFA